MPGTGICAPILNTINEPSRNHKRDHGKPLAALFADFEVVATDRLPVPLLLY